MNFKVCVRCSTYNQSPYIKDALDGFCMQKTTFPFVCTIIDDASTDGEQEIIKKYLFEHFDLEDELIVRNEETDDYVLTFVRHKTNINCFFAVLYLKYNHYSIKEQKLHYISEWLDSVEYEAHCEGDDYWTDPHKLQRQVSFLEDNPDYVLCFHNVKVFRQQEGEMVGDFITREVPETTTIADLADGNYIHTPSVVCRYIPEVYDARNRLCGVVVGDILYYFLLAQYGKIKKFSDCMAVYRYGVGVWSSHKVSRVYKMAQAISDLSKLLIVINDNAKPYVLDYIRSLENSCVSQYDTVYRDLNIVLHSVSYRLGSCLLAPISFLKRTAKKILLRLVLSNK